MNYNFEIADNKRTSSRPLFHRAKRYAAYQMSIFMPFTSDTNYRNLVMFQRSCIRVEGLIKTTSSTVSCCAFRHRHDGFSFTDQRLSVWLSYECLCLTSLSECRLWISIQCFSSERSNENITDGTWTNKFH